ncbi:MAG: hypothetical protein C0594_18050 [Marinilabiliales bacterium]|nr:MAG: hypothetical protein C0594_18050 [Marinilabiliales bacterium]
MIIRRFVSVSYLVLLSYLGVGQNDTLIVGRDFLEQNVISKIEMVKYHKVKLTNPLIKSTKYTFLFDTNYRIQEFTWKYSGKDSMGNDYFASDTSRFKTYAILNTDRYLYNNNKLSFVETVGITHKSSTFYLYDSLERLDEIRIYHHKTSEGWESLKKIIKYRYSHNNGFEIYNAFHEKVSEERQCIQKFNNIEQGKEFCNPEVTEIKNLRLKNIWFNGQRASEIINPEIKFIMLPIATEKIVIIEIQ